MDTHVVIMAGGIGSRLWPLSTPDRPKQFIDILGVGKSLIQLTVERFLPVCSPDRFWVVTSRKYVGLVREQLPAVPADQILAEPEGRNTAPCIAYASWKIAKKYPEANIVVTPADALVLKTAEFAEAIRKALAATEGTDAIVTVGIAPTRPETGYGYIHASEPVRGMSGPSSGNSGPMHRRLPESWTDWNPSFIRKGRRKPSDACSRPARRSPSTMP